MIVLFVNEKFKHSRENLNLERFYYFRLLHSSTYLLSAISTICIINLCREAINKFKKL